MKFVHDLQPIGSHHAKLANVSQSIPVNTQTQCPCCCKDLETQDHMLHCSANPRRRKTINEFNKKCKRRDGNWFLPIFADLISQWLVAPNQIPTFEKCRDTFLRHDIIPLAYTSLVIQAIMDQTMIGWLNAVRGFISQSWLTLASHTYQCESGQAVTRQDGKHNIQLALKALHFLSTEIWAGRNEILHNHQNQGIILQQNLVDATITRYHSEPDSLLHHDAHYCTTSLTRLLRSSPSNKRRWLHRVKASRLKKALIHTRQPRITAHFKTVAPLPVPEAPPWPIHSTPKIVTPTPTERNATVQQLMTFFFRERAPNRISHANKPSPPPPHNNSA